MKKRGAIFLIIMIIISSLLLAGGTAYLIYMISLLNSVEDLLRLLAVIIMLIIVLILIFSARKMYKKNKTISLAVILTIMILLGVGSLYIAQYVNKFYLTLKNVSAISNAKTYSSSIVTLSTNKATSLKNMTSGKIGIMNDKNSIESSVIASEVIKEEKIKNDTHTYTSYLSMIDGLYNGEVDYIFLPSNYSVMFSSMEEYSDIKDKTKIIYTKKKEIKEKASKGKQGKTITEPFTILLMGVDSETEGIAGSSFNGDSLMLITFNPKTLSSTILSIPRDSYVPITCFKGQKKNKITHAAWNGESCMINTIEKFLDVKIDYYVKINFKGVVSLVDTLGGVEIDVPYNMCEQDSNRQWGENTVYIKKGLQTLNGEQALAYSRNRHPNPQMCSKEWTNYNSDDFVRGAHQQEVVSALLNKFKDVKDLDTVYKLLQTISNNMVTNMSTDEILSLYNIVKDIAAKSSNDTNITDILGIERLALNGYSAMIVDYGGSNLSLYNYVLYNESVKAVSNAMKENLGLKKVSSVKSFSFDVNTPYEKKPIGSDIYGKKSLVQVPNFVGGSLSYATSWCSSHGISVSTNGSGTIVTKQSVPSGANVEDVKSIVITTSGSSTTKEEKQSTESNNKETKDTKTKTDNTKEETEKKEDKTEKKEETKEENKEPVQDLLPTDNTKAE